MYLENGVVLHRRVRDDWTSLSAGIEFFDRSLGVHLPQQREFSAFLPMILSPLRNFANEKINMAKAFWGFEISFFLVLVGLLFTVKKEIFRIYF